MKEKKEEYKIVYSPAAQEDVRSIYLYMAYGSLAERAARSQLDRIRNKINSLSERPSRYSAVGWEPWASMGMRSMPVDNYTVFYLVYDDNKLITIDRIL